MPYRIYIGLGSNRGDTEANVLKAIDQLVAHGWVLLQRSTLYTTEPVGEGLDGCFCNAVAVFDCAESADKALQTMLALETSMGRDRSIDVNRTIDLDILLVWSYRSASWEKHDAHPTVPHPRMWERDFVMQPLAEVCDNQSLATLRPDLSNPN